MEGVNGSSPSEADADPTSLGNTGGPSAALARDARSRFGGEVAGLRQRSAMSPDAAASVAKETRSDAPLMW